MGFLIVRVKDIYDSGAWFWEPLLQSEWLMQTCWMQLDIWREMVENEWMEWGGIGREERGEAGLGGKTRKLIH